MSQGHPAGVILTGGASKRMGVDKATLLVGQKPMVVSVADALWEAGCHPVECQGGDEATIGAYGLQVLADDTPGQGPLQAIRQALDRHAECDVVIAACDLADLDAETVSAVVHAGRDRLDADVAVASDGRRHMLAWWRAGSAGRLASLLGDGVTAYLDALDRLTTIDVPVASGAVRNVNSPIDLRRSG